MPLGATCRGRRVVLGSADSLQRTGEGGDLALEAVDGRLRRQALEAVVDEGRVGPAHALSDAQRVLTASRWSVLPVEMHDGGVQRAGSWNDAQHGAPRAPRKAARVGVAVHGRIGGGVDDTTL